MWIEPELVGRAVDETPRKDPVERPARGEGPLKLGLVGARVLGPDERLTASRRSQHRGIDARGRHEAGLRDTPDEAQLVPRSPRAAEHRRGPDGCPLHGRPPLHDHVELRQRHPRVAKQATQDRGAGREGQIRDDREPFGRQQKQSRVLLDDLHAGVSTEARLELPQRGRVELDGPNPRAGGYESPRERAAARAEVEHERARHDAGVADELVCEGAATKSVATAWPRLR